MLHNLFHSIPLRRRAQLLQKIVSACFGQTELHSGRPEKTLLKVGLLFIMDTREEQYCGNAVKYITEIGAAFRNDYGLGNYLVLRNWQGEHD
jgi:hypothetical protein